MSMWLLLTPRLRFAVGTATRLSSMWTAALQQPAALAAQAHVHGASSGAIVQSHSEVAIKLISGDRRSDPLPHEAMDAAAHWLKAWVEQAGFRYCDRMQIRWYGNRRGTFHWKDKDGEARLTTSAARTAARATGAASRPAAQSPSLSLNNWENAIFELFWKCFGRFWGFGGVKSVPVHPPWGGNPPLVGGGGTPPDFLLRIP